MCVPHAADELLTYLHLARDDQEDVADSGEVTTNVALM